MGIERRWSFQDGYNHAKHNWNNVYGPVIISLRDNFKTDEQLNPAISLLILLMEQVHLLKHCERTGVLKTHGSWWDIHNEFFGKVLDKKEVGILIGDFYNFVRHHGYPVNVFLDWKIAGVDMMRNSIFTVCSVKEAGGEMDFWMINVNNLYFTNYVGIHIDNYYNGTPIPEEYKSPKASSTTILLSDTALPKGSW